MPTLGDEVSNAIIAAADIVVDADLYDHPGVVLVVRTSKWSQSLPFLAVDRSKHVKWLMEVAGVKKWSEMVGRIVRVRGSEQAVVTIGHAIDDDWYEIGGQSDVRPGK